MYSEKSLEHPDKDRADFPNLEVFVLWRQQL